MEPELRAHVNLPVQLINHEGLYVIIAMLRLSILGCACVLTYSFTNYRKRKRNAETVRQYIVAYSGGAKVAGDKEDLVKLVKQPSAADDARTGGALSPTVSFEDLLDARNAISMHTARQRAAGGKGSDVVPAGRSANGTSSVLARQEALGTVRGVLQDGVGDDGASAAVAAASTVCATVVYSINLANGSTTTKPNFFAGAPWTGRLYKVSLDRWASRPFCYAVSCRVSLTLTADKDAAMTALEAFL